MTKFLKTHRFTIARRFTQVLTLCLFVAGNVFGVKILQGNLSSSELFGVTLSDPLAVAQLLLAGGMIGVVGLLGAAFVLAFYALIAPRAFCGWVCPVNLVTDAANFVKIKFGFNKSFITLPHSFSYAFLALSLVCSALFSLPVWESVSFVGALTREAVVLSGEAVVVGLILFAFEFVAAKRTVCGRLCPLGAFWTLASRFSLLRVGYLLDKCSHCGRCVQVCPHESALKMVGKNDAFVTSECVSCGRCVQVCEDEALKFDLVILAKKHSKN